MKKWIRWTRISLVDLSRVRRHLTRVIGTISSKGQIVLPAEFRERDGVEPGQQFEIERLESGKYQLSRVDPPANEGVVQWLMTCPEKGFFTPIESESTDQL